MVQLIKGTWLPMAAAFIIVAVVSFLVGWAFAPKFDPTPGIVQEKMDILHAEMRSECGYDANCKQLFLLKHDDLFCNEVSCCGGNSVGWYECF